MKLWDVIKKVGGRAIREAVPGGGILIDTVNALLPEDKRLPSGASGADMEAAIESLPADARGEIYAKRYDVQIEDTRQRADTMRAMLAAESESKHTTRPYIAKHSFHVLALATTGVVAGWMAAVFKTSEPLAAIMDGWPFVVAILAPYVALLRAYFGMLSSEHKNRLDSAHGSTAPAGILGSIATMINKGHKK